ncbi:MAG: MarR family transcriptional regulator, partial [Polyangiaceae bacterium]
MEPQLGPVLEFMQRLWAVDHGLQSKSKYMEMNQGVTG